MPPTVKAICGSSGGGGDEGGAGQPMGQNGDVVGGIGLVRGTCCTGLISRGGFFFGKLREGTPTITPTLVEGAVAEQRAGRAPGVTA